MKQFFHKKTILVLLLGITLIMIVVSLVYKPIRPLPTIISTSLTTNSTKVNYFDPVWLKFDQSINPSLISIKSIPEESWSVGLVEGDPTSIVLNHARYFHVNTDYSLTIFYDSQQINVLKFRTAPQQNDPRYVQEVNSGMARDYPLATKIPFENNSFKIVYSAPLTLEITSKNPNLKSQELIDEVKSWVTQNGGDASAHKYVVASPAPSPTN